jgi:hypothetical protein
MRKLLFFLVPCLAMLVLGGLWNSVLLQKIFAFPAPVIARPPAEVRLGVIALAYALLTAFMAFLFTQSSPNPPGSLAGFRFGSLFGVIMTLPVYLLLYAAWNVSLRALLVDAGWHAIEQGVGGVLMAVLLAEKRPPINP